MIDNPRLDLVISLYGRTLLIVLLVIGVLAVAATGWAVANPPTTNTTERVGSETVSTELETSAVVTRDGLWSEGDVLENRPIYLRNATPTATITPRTTVPSDDVTVTHDVAVRTEAVRDANGQEVFWDETYKRDRLEATVEDGVATSNLTLDLDAFAAHRRGLDEDLRAVGTIRHVVEVTVEYDTGSNAGTQTLSTTLHVSDRAYWFGELPSDSTTHTETAQVTATQSRNPVFVGGLLLIGVLAFGAAAAVWERRPVDREAARRRVHERRYAEWISHGTIPMWIGEHHVSLDTLEDVVDVAIDTNERVVHDRQRDLFAVVSESVVYYYSANGFWEETAWPEMDLEGESSVPPDIEPGGSSPAGPSAGGQQPGTGTPPPDELPDADDDDAWRQL